MGDTLRFGIVSRTIFYAPLWLGAARGWFERAGITIDVTIYNDADAMLAALLSGHEDLTIGTPEGIILNALGGGPLRIIGCNVERPPHFIIARPHVRSVADLRAGRIGVLSAKEGTSYLFKRVAAAAGLREADYQFVEVGGAPTRMRLLKEGKIDAGLQPFPLSYDAEVAGLTNLGPVADVVPYYLFTSINMSADQADRLRVPIMAFLTIFSDAQSAIRWDPADAATETAAELQTRPQDAERALHDAVALEIFAPHLRLRAESLEPLLSGLVDNALISDSQRFDAAVAFDASFAI